MRYCVFLQNQFFIINKGKVLSQVSEQPNADKVPLPMATKMKFMNHVNDEHQDELALFIEAFAETKICDDMRVSVAEVYSDGLLLEATAQNIDTQHIDTQSSPKTVGAGSQFFIQFETMIDETVTLKSQYIKLLQVASKKLGKPAIKQQDRQFNVIEGYYASPNMFRLVVKAAIETPLDHAGFAYLFDVKNDLPKGDELKQSAEKLQRYYTLRKAWKDAASHEVSGWVDAYIHGDTPGGNWARAAQVGTQIKSVRDYPEKIAHLKSGQCLLICDETSLPTIANLLESWQNPIAPIVIAVTNDAEDISYLRDLELSQVLAQSDNFKQDNILHIINKPALKLPDAILAAVDMRLEGAFIDIEKIWGALRSSDAKQLRYQLKAKFGLSRHDMIMKVYWR